MAADVVTGSRPLVGARAALAVTRWTVSQGARRTWARLTEAGAQTVSRVEPGYAQEVHRHVLDRLAPSRAEQLETLTEAVLTPLRPSCGRALPPRTSG